MSLVISFAKLQIVEILFIAFSSIFPTLLYIKYVDIKRVRRKILESWLISSSIPPNPSVSIKMMSMSSLGITFFQSQRPLVQGLMVGPTLNPPYLFNNTLFTKKLLPVRYFPTTLIIPNFFDFKFFRKSPASGFSLIPFF